MIRRRVAWVLRRLANRIDPIQWEYDETEPVAIATINLGEFVDLPPGDPNWVARW